MQTKHILHCHHLTPEVGADTQQAEGRTVFNRSWGGGAKEKRTENDEGDDAKISVLWGRDGWLQAGYQVPLPKM